MATSRCQSWRSPYNQGRRNPNKRLYNLEASSTQRSHSSYGGLGPRLQIPTYTWHLRVAGARRHSPRKAWGEVAMGIIGGCEQQVWCRPFTYSASPGFERVPWIRVWLSPFSKTLDGRAELSKLIIWPLMKLPSSRALETMEQLREYL